MKNTCVFVTTWPVMSAAWLCQVEQMMGEEGRQQVNATLVLVASAALQEVYAVSPH